MNGFPDRVRLLIDGNHTLALEAALRARGPLGLNDLLSEARRRGLGKGPLA